MRKLHRVLLTFIAIIAIFLLPFYLFIAKTKEEKLFDKQISELAAPSKTPFSNIPIFSGYNPICILTPYSAGSITSAEKRLPNIFGNVEYKVRLDEIISNSNNDGIWSLYLVKDNKILNTIRIRRSGIGKEVNLKSGCYKSEMICLEKGSFSNGSKSNLKLCN